MNVSVNVAVVCSHECVWTWGGICTADCAGFYCILGEHREGNLLALSNSKERQTKIN